MEAQADLEARRRLTRILRFKTTTDVAFAPGDTVDVYIKDGTSKRGKWILGRSVLSVDKAAWTVTVPSLTGRPISVAVEDVRASVNDQSLADLIRQASDQVDDDLAILINDLEARQDQSADYDHEYGEEVPAPSTP